MLKFISILLIGALAGAGAVQADEAAAVLEALKSRYVDRDQLDPQLVTDATINGLVKALGPSVKLLSAAEAKTPPALVEPKSLSKEPLARAEVIEPNIGYLRLANVEPAAETAVDQELAKFSQAKVNGFVLDLRYANGTNYAVAAAIASRFVSGTPALFAIKDRGESVQQFQATALANAVASLAEAPLMVLVNEQTRGAGEALAAALRAQERAIVIGAPTAGLALAWEDIRLADGRVLRLATSKLTLPGEREVFPHGLIPDVPVKIDPKTESEVVLNAATNMTLTASLQPTELRKGMREADLMRAFRGEAIDSPSLTLSNNAANAATNQVHTSGTDPAPPANGNGSGVRDVVLQRAVDILKGIRVLLTLG